MGIGLQGKKYLRDKTGKQIIELKEREEDPHQWITDRSLTF